MIETVLYKEILETERKMKLIYLLKAFGLRAAKEAAPVVFNEHMVLLVNLINNSGT